MVECMKATGKITTCTAKVSTNGPMEGGMTVIMLMTRRMAMESTLIPMVEAIRVSGRTANSMVRVFLLALKESPEKASGRMVKDSTGPMR